MSDRDTRQYAQSAGRYPTTRELLERGPLKGWSLEYRAVVGSDLIEGGVTYDGWTADMAEAEQIVKDEGRYEAAWLETRFVSPPERVSEEDKDDG